MSSRTKFINVLPNPYFTLDDQGNPSGVCPVDPSVNPRREFIGARLVNVEMLDNFEQGDLRSPRQYNSWEFSTEPVSVQLTEYYKEKLRTKELFPADETSAKLAGVPWQGVTSYRKLAEDTAVREWETMYHEKPHWYVEEIVEKPSVTKLTLVTEEKSLWTLSY